MHACSQLKLLKCKRKHFSYQITNIVVYFYICMKMKRAMKVDCTANKIYLYLGWMNNEYCIALQRNIFKKIFNQVWPPDRLVRLAYPAGRIFTIVIVEPVVHVSPLWFRSSWPRRASCRAAAWRARRSSVREARPRNPLHLALRRKKPTIKPSPSNRLMVYH